MGQIQISNRKPFDQYIWKSYPRPLPRGFSSHTESTAPSALRVLFRESAVADIWKAIDWGKQTLRNRTEQGGILVGNFCDAAPKGSTVRDVWVEVIHAIPCEQPEISTPEFLLMSAENWLEMENTRSRNNLRDRTDYLLVGWYHTHPGRLPTGFSGTDYNTHSSQFPFEYSVGAVFNPQRKIWSVYYGPSCAAAFGHLCVDSDGIVASLPSSETREKGKRDTQMSYTPPQLETRCAEDTLYLECQWYQLVLDSVFLLGPPQIIVQQNYNLRSNPINKQICNVCSALIRLLHSDGTIRALIATVEIFSNSKLCGSGFRIHHCDFCYSIPTWPASRSRRESMGLFLVGDPAGLQKDLATIYRMIDRQYSWFAICDTKDIAHFHYGQIKLYII